MERSPARASRLSAAAFTLFALAACSSDGPVQPDALQGPPAASAASQAPEQVVAGEVVVRLRGGADAASVARAHGLDVAEVDQGNRFVVMRGATGAEHANARAIANDTRVQYAEPNYLREITAINPRLWAFYNPGGLNMLFTRGKNSGQPIGSGYASLADADEDNVEGYAAGGGAVVIGSIDTGVDFAHPEFRNPDGTSRLIAGRDWYSKDDDPRDQDGHGTHTTGTMIGNTVGVASIAGAAPNVRVLVQRVCGPRGCPTSAIVSAIYAAADYPGMVAMNLSLGGSTESQAEKDAITYATSKNVLVIASSGNNGAGTVSCPACDPNAISVGATNWRDARASYSNFGPGLDVAAPGGECYSNTTADGCIYSAYPNGGYAWLQGTSMAAPQVTGTAALVASVRGFVGAGLRSQLLLTADPVGAALHFGSGRLNSYRAVTGGSLAPGQ